MANFFKNLFGKNKDKHTIDSEENANSSALDSRQVDRDLDLSDIQHHNFTFEKYDEDFAKLNKVAYVFLNYEFSNMNIEYGKDWAWLQIVPPEVRFQHICIRYKDFVLCILIGLYRHVSGNQGQMFLKEQELNNLKRECEKHHMTPCLFLINCATGEPLYKNPYLIDARTMDLIDLDNLQDTNNGIMSEWELNNAGIQVVTDYLKEKGCTDIAHCDVVGIQPQIWFVKDGVHSYIFIRSIPAGLADEKYRINLASMKKNAPAKGYFVDVQWNNLLGNNGDFKDKVIYRYPQSLVHSKIRLIEIEKAIKELPFIETFNGNLYVVRDNR